MTAAGLWNVAWIFAASFRCRQPYIALLLALLFFLLTGVAIWRARHKFRLSRLPVG